MKGTDVRGIIPYPHVHVELTNICNFSCDFCPESKMTRRKGFMRIELAKKIINELSEEKLAKSINFHMMGEPLVYPHLFEIIEYAKHLNLETQITTNGALLTKDNCKKLFASGLTRLYISFVTPTPSLFKVRGANISFNEYETRILNAIEEKIKTHSKTQITLSLGVTFPLTIKERLMNIVDGRSTSLIQTYEEAIKQKERFIKKIEEILEYYNENLFFKDTTEIDRILHNDYGITIVLRSFWKWGVVGKYESVFGSCSAPFDHFSILWNGDLTICCLDYDGEGVIGNVESEKILNILNSHEMIKIRECLTKNRLVAPVCRKCRSKENMLSSLVYQSWNVFKSFVQP